MLSPISSIFPWGPWAPGSGICTQPTDAALPVPQDTGQGMAEVALHPLLVGVQKPQLREEVLEVLVTILSFLK